MTAVVIAILIAAFWNRPEVRPGRLLVGGLLITVSLFPVNWILLVIGVLLVISAFARREREPRGGNTYRG